MPQQTSLDIKTQEQLQILVKKIKAEYAEIRAEESLATRIIFKGDTPESIIEPYTKGYFIRVLVNGAWGITTCTDSKSLPEKVTQAIHLANIQKKGNAQLAHSLQHIGTITT